jgi:hypothetical protein
MYLLSVQGRSIAIKLVDLYPECEFLIKGSPQLHPLICFVGPCHRNANCMEKLAKRVKYVFEQFKDAQLLVLYFKYQDKPNSIRAGVFWRDLREPRYITINPYAWEHLKKRGEVYEWNLPDFLTIERSIQSTTPQDSVLQLPVIK